MNKQAKIKYPDRTAKFLRESSQLSNLLDGDGEGVLEMEEQQKRQMQEARKEYVIRETASQTQGSTTEIKIVPRPQFLPMRIPDSDYGSVVLGSEPDVSMSSLHDDISDEVFETEQQLIEKQEKAEAEAKLMLKTIYLGVAEKLANRPSPPSYAAPIQTTKKTIDKRV
jgi:hypothetical protein